VPGWRSLSKRPRKKNFETTRMLRTRRVFFEKKFVPLTNMFGKFTEKVQVWKLFSEKTLFLE
jgi:hypothetical protein